jgi:hypothetical protein
MTAFQALRPAERSKAMAGIGQTQPLRTPADRVGYLVQPFDTSPGAMPDVSAKTLPTAHGYEWTGTACQEVAASGQTGVPSSRSPCYSRFCF